MLTLKFICLYFGNSLIKPVEGRGGGGGGGGGKSNVFARKSNLSEPRSDLIPALAQMGRVHKAYQALG